MKLPAPIGGLIVTAITGGVAISGEVGLSHPLHQAVILAGALAAGVVGYFTLPLASGPVVSGPPYPIPAVLPTPAPLTQAQIDQLAANPQVSGLGLPPTGERT
jgi:hypothetical protein